MSIRELVSLQNSINILIDKKEMKKQVTRTRIHVQSIKGKIRKVLMNTKSKIIKRHQFIQNQRLKLVKKLKQLKETQEYLHEYKLCEIWDDNGKIQTLSTDQPDNSCQYYEQMLEQSDKQFEQIKNHSNYLAIILKDFEENGLSLFKEFQQKQQQNIVDIKKAVHEVDDIFEEDDLKLEKVNQIYIQFYNLSLQPCGICLVQPEIDQIIILNCGHSLCYNCFQSFRSSERTKTYFRRCPFCRQQIEFLASESEKIEKN